MQPYSPTFRNRKGGQKIFAAQTPQRKRSYIYGWLVFAYLGRKRVIHFHVQPYSPTFRNRKSRQKIFAAQTPQRKRGFLSTHQAIVGKVFVHLQNPLSSLADAPHCSMGLGSKQNLFISTSTLMPCHVTVCVNCALGSKMQFLCVITQSTGHIFLPGLPVGKMTFANLTLTFRCFGLNFCSYSSYLIIIFYFRIIQYFPFSTFSSKTYSLYFILFRYPTFSYKKLCAKLNSTHRVIFYLVTLYSWLP